MIASPPIIASSFYTSSNGTWNADIGSHGGTLTTLTLELRPVGSPTWITVWSLSTTINTSLNDRGGGFGTMRFEGIRWDASIGHNQTYHLMNSVNNIITFLGDGRPTRSVNVTQTGRVRRGIYSP